MKVKLLALKQQGKNRRRTLRRQADKVKEELVRRGLEKAAALRRRPAR